MSCVRVKKTEGDPAVSIKESADLEDIVGADVFREFRPRETEPARPPRRGGPAWQATDAINGWVTERRRGRSPADRGSRGDGPRR